MLANNKNHSLTKELPFWEFFQEKCDYVMLQDGSIVAGIQCSPLSIEGWSDEQINHLTTGFRSLLNSLDEGLSVQFYLRSKNINFEDFRDKHFKSAPLRNTFFCNLTREKERQFESQNAKRQLLKKELFIFFRLECIEKNAFSLFQKKKIREIPPSMVLGRKKEMLFQVTQQFSEDLKTLGIKSTPLKMWDFKELLYQFFNPRRSEDCNLNKNFDRKDLREEILFSDLSLDVNHFNLDSHLHKLLTLKAMPEWTLSSQMNDFFKVPFPCELVLSIHVPVQSYEMSRLSQQRKMAHSLTVTKGNQTVDLESESKLSATEELIREILETGQKIYNVQLNVLLREEATTTGQQNLDSKTKKMLSQFRFLQGAEAMEETVGMWKVLKGIFPGAPINLERARKMKTNNLADFLPLYGDETGDENPMALFHGRQGSVIGTNSFSPNLPNYNTLVTGASGSGKSFFHNALLMQEMKSNLQTYILDVGGSYKKLTSLMEGEYFEVRLDGNCKINPFYLPEENKTPSEQKIKFLLSLIEIMISEEVKSSVSKLDKVLLEKEIIELYERFMGKKEGPTLSDFRTQLENSKDENLIKIAKLLYPWSGNRPYGKLIDCKNFINTNSEICTFDLKGLSQYPDLQSAMILILTDFILMEIEQKKKGAKKIILDEAWELLKSPAASNFMEYCARTLRKTGSGITFITQGLDEIVASPIGAAIINNTATKIILKQNGDTQILKDVLKLNPSEIELIASLRQEKGYFSEAFITNGMWKSVMQLRPTPHEYWAATSDAKDNLYLQELVSKGIELPKALWDATKEFPQGVGGRT
jgi:conjugal transfer ATP-binding protein TraC